MTRTDLLQLYLRLGLMPIPLKPGSKEPLVKWRNGWNPTPAELQHWQREGCNWAVRCGCELAVLDFDSADLFHSFLKAHPGAASWPRVRTGRGFHLWLRPKRPVSTQRHDGLEVKSLGSYVVAPPSIHPNGTTYVFEVAPDGVLPEVDLEELLGLGQIDLHAKPIGRAAPSDFALRYGKSPWPQSMCGKATKVLTRSDGKVKHLLSLRCWKWDCPKCAPLLKRYWLEKLSGFSFRFILQLPNEAKPTTFLRRVGKPPYVHILANGESWLFLIDGEAELIWAEARRAGYELVAGDIAGDPTPEEISGCLDKALCREEEPLNSRRKVTHSRGIVKRASQKEDNNESKQQGDCNEGEDDTKTAYGNEPLTWESEVVMKPIEQVASELEDQGWRMLWQSEVEAIAIRNEAPEVQDIDLVELLGILGVKLRKVGKEYMGLCPFHDDHKPSLSVNQDKGLWHCFGCGRGGDARRLVEEWQALRH